MAAKIAEELLHHRREYLNQDIRERIAGELLELTRAPSEGLNRRHKPLAEPRPVVPTTEIEKWYHGAQNPNLKGAMVQP